MNSVLSFVDCRICNCVVTEMRSAQINFPDSQETTQVTTYITTHITTLFIKYSCTPQKVETSKTSTNDTMVSNIGQLPNEVLYQIALHLPPTSLPVFQRVCCRFDQLVDNLIWRKLCATRFKYWDSRHRIKAKLAGESNDIDWKILFIQRHLVDRSTSDALNSILSSQQDRLDKFQQIISHGYDAKDCLMRHFQVADSADDVLARRCVHLQRGQTISWY